MCCNFVAFLRIPVSELKRAFLLYEIKYTQNKKYKLNLRLVCGVNLGRFPDLAMSSVFVYHQKLQNPILHRLYKTLISEFKTPIDLTSNNN